MRTVSRRGVAALIAAAVIIAAGVIAWMQRDTLMALLGEAGERPGARPPPVVEVATAERADVPERLSATGTLIAPESVMITAEAPGRVERIAFTEGARVEKDEVLVRLETTAARAELDRAEARLVEREHDLRRMRELGREQFVSEGELDRAVAAAKSARAEVDLARERLDDLTLTAPFAGVTDRRLISPGALVQPDTPITRLRRTDSLDLLVDVPGTEVARIEPGMAVRARTPAYPERRFEGTVTFVGSAVERATRTLPLEVRIDNTHGLLKPGMYLEAELLLAERQIVRVPEAAVVARGPVQRVYVLGDDSKADRRTVRTGTRRDGWVEIVEGVQAGERIVTAGLGVLRDGMRVQVAPEREGSARQ
ncbi:MAG: efflux RND transporter periplasmic adaptor subunit [Thiohalocapsa sp.]|nr:efflux RND transporter periplasmic adaptor subunit [Thiohalocapsa sp.]MCF7991483.1 efflux RND transporter periplasmic adaptor subunit [Thiohalocapsa sp.]